MTRARKNTVRFNNVEVECTRCKEKFFVEVKTWSLEDMGHEIKESGYKCKCGCEILAIAIY